MNVRTILEEYDAVFLDRGCLFASTNQDVLLSGYVQCEVLFPRVDLMSQLGHLLAEPFINNEAPVEVFMSASVGDIALLRDTARSALDAGLSNIKAVWADEQPGGPYRLVRSGFAEVVQGKRVVIVVDAFAQGGTTRSLITEARRCGGIVMGIVAISGASHATADTFDVPELHVLAPIDVEVHPLNDLPDHWKMLPVARDIGHGRRFRRTHGTTWRGGYVSLLK